MKQRSLIILTVAFALFIARAGAQKISLGPGILTFPEIAQKLSAQGKTVQCAPELTQRAAFVYLKNRSWADTESLLANGLQLRFYSSNDSVQTLTMSREPDAASRQHRWLSQFVKSYRTFVQAGLDSLTPYSAMNDSEARQACDDITKQIATIATQLGELGAQGESSRNRIENLRHQVTVLNGLVGFLRSSTRRVDYAWIKESAITSNEIEDAITAGQTIHVTNIDAAQSAALRSVEQLFKDHTPDVVLPNYDQLAGGWQFSCNQSGMNLAAKLEILGRDQMPLHLGAERVLDGMFLLDMQDHSLTDTVFQGLSFGGLPIFGGAGRDAAAWLASERAQTDRYLSTDRAQQAVTVKTGSVPAADLSQFIEAWASQTDSEAIMELAPQEEAVASTVSRSTFQLGDLYDAKKSPWSFVESNRVLLVTNRLAFLDRLPNLPIAALIQYERAVGSASPQWGTPADVSAYRAMRSYCEAVSSFSCSPWIASTNIYVYRGADTTLLDHSVGVLFLWNNLTAPEQGTLLDTALRQAEKPNSKDGTFVGKESSLHLSHFGSHNVAGLLDEFKRSGFANIACYREGYYNWMWKTELTVRLAQAPDRSGFYTINLSLTPHDVDTDVSFLWKPK